MEAVDMQQIKIITTKNQFTKLQVLNITKIRK